MSTQPICRRLEGRVALVTDAASEIGYATAVRLVEEGAQVIFNDVDEVKGSLAAQSTSDILASLVTLGVTSESQWIDVVADIKRRFGPLDALVNNVGLGLPPAIEETTLETWHRCHRPQSDQRLSGHEVVQPNAPRFR